MALEVIGNCPFCGKSVYVDVTDEEGNYPTKPGYENDPYSGLCYVLVHNFDHTDEHLCPVARGEGECLGVIYDSKEEAIASWNNRAEPISNSDELPEWLREKIEQVIEYARLNSKIDYDKYYYLGEPLKWVLSLKKDNL